MRIYDTDYCFSVWVSISFLRFLYRCLLIDVFNVRACLLFLLVLLSHLSTCDCRLRWLHNYRSSIELVDCFLSFFRFSDIYEFRNIRSDDHHHWLFLVIIIIGIAIKMRILFDFLRQLNWWKLNEKKTRKQFK